MSFIEKTAFEPRITNNEFNDLCNIAGRYQNSGADADCSAGMLTVQDTQMPCEGFTGVYNENAWYMKAAGANDTAVYACNTYESAMLGDGVHKYYIGRELLGLGAPAGRNCTFTAIDFDGKSVYRFGEGNVNGTVGSNKYFTIAAGMLVPASAAPSSGVYFELRGTGTFTAGTTESFGYVDVVAKAA